MVFDGTFPELALRDMPVPEPGSGQRCRSSRPPERFVFEREVDVDEPTGPEFEADMAKAMAFDAASGRAL